MQRCMNVREIAIQIVIVILDYFAGMIRHHLDALEAIQQ